MNDISKEVFNKYKIRKTRRQKDKFIDFIKQKYPKVIVEEDTYYKKNKNLIFGDIEKARCIIASHYDTKSLINDFERKYLRHSSTIFSYVVIYLLVAIFGIIAGIVGYKTNNMKIAYYIELFILLLVLLSLVIPGFKTNNDNTSGVITILELIEKAKYDNVAFVLFDNKESKRQGSRSFKIKHEKLLENKLIINVDSIADGDYIAIITNKKAQEKYKYRIASNFSSPNNLLHDSLTVKYESDHIGYPMYMLVIAVDDSKLGYYSKNINKKFYSKKQEKNIRQVVKELLSFVQNCI